MNLIEQWKSADVNSPKVHQKEIKKLVVKTNKNLNSVADKLHVEVFSELDCLDCANCCKSIPPMLVKSDVKRIAKHLGLKEKEFEQKYLKIDDDGDMVMGTSPCIFLENDNTCRIYEVRPKACRQYPHTDAHSFRQNAHLHAINAMYCPAVFHILNRLQEVFKK